MQAYLGHALILAIGTCKHIYRSMMETIHPLVCETYKGMHETTEDTVMDGGISNIFVLYLCYFPPPKKYIAPILRFHNSLRTLVGCWEIRHFCFLCYVCGQQALHFQT
eukprot:GHVO01027717.1.p1 GENE.GHVO01027717.1~~GHVO01027717.1.p1  ORF type:complete len:108 (+),score=8.09 GHVO01027717.1:310-633(+)